MPSLDIEVGPRSLNGLRFERLYSYEGLHVTRLV